MESSNGVAISDEKQFQIHGPCIPSCVPFIPTPNYPNRTVRVHFIATGEGGSQVKTRSRQFSTMSMVNNVPVMNVDHQEAVCPTRAQVCSWGSNVPFVQLLTCTDRSLAASLQTQIDNSSSQQHQPHSANLSPHTSQNHFLQMPQNGFPVQHINSNGSQSGKSCDQEKTGFDGNAYEENNTATDTPLQQHDSVHTSNPIVSNNVQDSQPVLTNQEIDSPVKNNEIEANSNIDLNKTPVQQKKRRRKHRPKVVVEGKAKRTPKPVTPKETNKEAPPGKRKYTRRAKTMESTTSEDLRMPTNTSTGGPISDNPGEDARLKEAFTSMFTNSNLVEVRVEDRCTIMTPAQQERPQSSATPSSEFKENVGISREASRKSCRRSLNFSLECQTEHMGTHSSAEDRHLPNRHIEGPFDLPESDLRTYSQNRDCREFNIFPGTRLSLPPVETVHALLSEPYPNTGVDSTLHLEEELGLVTDKSSGLAFDLNCCYTQHDHCSALPGKTNHLSVMKENIKALATNGNAENNLNGDDNHQNMSSTKRESQGNISSNNLQFSKRRRTAMGNGVRRANNGNHFMLQSLRSSIGGCGFPCMENTHANTACRTANETSLNIPMDKEDQQQEFGYSKLLGELMAVPVERKTKKKWNRSSQVRSLPCMAIVSKNNKLQSPPRMACEPDNNPQPCMEALAAGNDVKIKKKRTKKERSSILPNPTIGPDSHQVLHGKVVNALKNRSTENLKVRKSATYKDPIEEIIYKLMCLTIDENSMQNMAGALVRYSGDRTIVPYEGPLKTKRKQHPRARVDMDAETARVFNLLMWNEGSDSSEAKDKEKEKWWEEQRSMFRGRVDSFIARMHLVQGDRRFSPWKGSVVDSVVGVFLTQNVSDHLSSSAFMALAARFPIKSHNSTKGSDLEEMIINAQEQEVCILDLDENAGLENERSDQGSVTHGEVEIVSQQFESIVVESTSAHSKGAQLATGENGQDICLEQENDKPRTSNRVNGHANLEFIEDRKGTEDAVSPQFSIISSQNSTESLVLDNQLVDPNVPCLESSSDVDYSVDNHLFPSFTELLTSQILGGNFQDNILHDENGCMLERVPDVLDRGSECMQFENRNSCFTGISDLNGFNSSSYGSATHPPSDMHTICCSDCQLHPCEGPPGMLELLSTEASGEGTRCHSTTNGSQSTEVDHISFAEEVIDQRMKDVQSTNQQKLLSCNEIVSLGELNAHESNSPIHESHALQVRAYHEKHSDHCNSFAEERTRKVSSNDNFHGCSESDMRQTVLQGDTKVGTAGVARPPSIPNDTLEIENFGSQPFGFNQPKRHDGNSDVPTSLNLMDNQLLAESTGVDTNSQVVESKNQATEINGKSPKVKKAKRSTEKKDFDWDSLRRDVCCKGPKKERTPNRMDSLDWEAVRCANVSEIADTIRARGMNNMLAGRIKDFLNRVVADHGSINLEWLRDIPPEKAKDYLLSIRGLGLKSVECVRLLTLHHLAFPVDTNVGRICVRLGWVPLQPLPESLQLHLLELYPILETIQKYLWPRLCTLDQRTLYELHYQMITFGKVFCTKSKPNCNACPMRAECRHFASAFASARLALPGPEEKSIVSLVVPASAEGHRQIVDPLPLPPIETNAHSQAAYINKTREPVPLPLPPIEINAHSQAAYSNRMCEPIIEEPPEPPDQEFLEGSQNEIQASEKEIEDTFWQDDPDEIPTIKLNIQEFAANVQTYIEQSMELLDGEMSKALVALTPEVASIPMPKLKNVSRLRTEHQVYELPDSHPLLAGLDRREPDDPCSYLLAIWTPGETVKSTEQPETCCNSDESGNLCDSETCFTCNSVREARAQTVRGTLLIPCRTAMRGSFPLNGTYFQVNEVFADHDSSLKPIDVPRSWIWNLPRRTVYFGTSIPTIFRGLTTEGIQHCFWRGFVCVRGFDQRTRAPRPLIARLHFPASKIVRARKTQPNLNE